MYLLYGKAYDRMPVHILKYGFRPVPVKQFQALEHIIDADMPSVFFIHLSHDVKHIQRVLRETFSIVGDPY